MSSTVTPETVDLEKYLGRDTSPSDFASEEEIAEYFDQDNLNRMFPGETFNSDEVDAAYHRCVQEWKLHLGSR